MVFFDFHKFLKNIISVVLKILIFYALNDFFSEHIPRPCTVDPYSQQAYFQSLYTIALINITNNMTKQYTYNYDVPYECCA